MTTPVALMAALSRIPVRKETSIGPHSLLNHFETLELVTPYRLTAQWLHVESPTGWHLAQSEDQEHSR